jgi:ribonuclease HI
MTMVLETDGSSRGNPGKAGAGYVLSMDGKVVADKRHLGITTNNVAEYTAMIMGLERATRMGASRLVAVTDSLLLARQMAGSYRVRQSHLKPLHKRCMELVSKLQSFEIRYVPSHQNRAHLLAHQAAGE